MDTLEQGARSEYLTAAETAKLIRQALKQAFPEYGSRFFGVRSKTYSGGASIRVNWTDGPTTEAVDAVVARFAGGGFDGMIDMAYNREAWLAPDGSVSFAHTGGTQSSMGTVPERFGSRHNPDARLVRFGANFVFTDRDLSDEAEAWVKQYRDDNYARASWQADYEWDRLTWELKGRTTWTPQGEPQVADR